MLWGLNRLKPDEGDLHGAEQAEDEEGVVGDVDAVGEPVHQDEDDLGMNPESEESSKTGLFNISIDAQRGG